MVHGNYYVTLIVYDEFSKKILTLTYGLNVVIGHYLDFTEADWPTQLSYDKIICIFYKQSMPVMYSGGSRGAPPACAPPQRPNCS